MEGAFLAGVANSDWTWSVKFGDLDNDGRIDLYVNNGMARNFNDSDIPFNPGMLIGQTEWAIYEKGEPRKERCKAFRNRGDYDFEDVAKAWGLDHLGMSYGAAYADLNGTGNLDLVVTRLDEPVTIFRNRETQNHRIEFFLKGSHGNTSGIGATVRLTSGGVQQMRMLSAATGFISQNEPMIHFGLGDRTSRATAVSITWPGGRVQTFTDLAADKAYTITEPAPSPNSSASRPPASLPPPSRPPYVPTGTSLFTKADIPAFEAHHETPFDDFKRQPLLPNKLSQLGPGLAVGDVNGDGLDDLFVSGAAGQASMLYINNGKGGFEKLPQPAFEADKASESMGAVFFDARGSGINDLYVASGGVEGEPNDAVFRGRLYFNDGKGNFTKAPDDALPDTRESSSVVCAGDFDGDGKLDLFVGGRVIPGRWPEAPQSQLLHNEGGKFKDVIDDVAPGLRRIGMATSAIWSDVDGDGKLDLMVTLEWGAPHYLHNENGKLVDRSREAGLLDYTGWWNGIAARDLDGSGHISFVVTNFGLNNKYHASLAHPTQLYYGDFDGTGNRQIVEAEFEDETLFPVRGRSCSSRAMPILKEKFKTYKDWALAPLDVIYDKPKLETALHFQATTLESGVLLNDGTGRFKFKPLPHLAQIFPAYGCVLTDVAGDGIADLYMVGNFFGPQVETGRMDGGLTLLLKGNGDGTFKEIWPAESGLVIPGDSKSLVTLDLNGDGWPDFVIGKNDEKPEVYERQLNIPLPIRPYPKIEPLRVRLKGPAGNPTCIGARVTVELENGKKQTDEVRAGGGYLSQSTATLTFGLDKAKQAKSITVHWPNGKTTTSNGGSGAVVLEQP